MPFNRGIIGKYANTSSRTGLVTAKEQFILAAGGFYPRFVDKVASTISRLLNLLIKTDGSNGGNNTSITDSSTNAYSITVNGNSQTASISPHDPEGYSYYFDGTDDYLSIAYNSSLDITQQSKATMEAWIYIPSTHSSNDSIFTNRPVGATIQGVDVRLTSSRTIQYYETGAGSLVGTIVIPYREWTHVAVVKTGGGVYIYINGILDNSTEIFNSGTAGSNPTYIGRTGGGGTDYINAYLRDVRVVTGVDVYTSAFTPPTEPLTAISGTKLLTCHLPYLADGSTNDLSITINGNPYADPISPYQGIPFDADLHGGSVYFDGSGDYLSIADATPLDLGNGSTDFTIEFWALADSAYNTSTSDYVFYSKYQNPGNGIIIRVWNGELVVNLSGDAFDIETGFYPQPGIWHHYALVCNSGTVTMYVNGVSRGTYSSAIVGDSSTSTTIGCLYFSGVINPFKGYISDFRIVKGTAVYTAAFTPPTEPLTAVANTSLLIKGNESAIYDATGFSTIVLGGNATTSNTVTKYATSSIYLDGSGDYLYTDNIDFPDDFTIEGWFYFSAFSGNMLLFDTYSSGVSGTWQLYRRSTGTSLAWYDTSSTAVTIQDANASRLSTGTWYHIAATRNNGELDIWVDGASVANTSGYTTDLTHSNPLVLGTQYSTSTNYFNGYMEDVRVTKGLSRYPWIPEKRTLTADSNTILLAAHSSSIEDGSDNNASISVVGNAAVSTFAPISGMYSVDFDGTNDGLSIANPYTTFGSLAGDYTIECWVNMDAVPADDGNGYENQIIGQHNWPESSPYNGFWALFAVASGVYYYTSTGSSFTLHQATGMSWTVGKWTHVAVVKSSGTVYIYIDGGLQTSGANSDTILANDTRNLTIGLAGNNNTDFNGQISNLRVSNTVRYTNSFTPPTAALT